jgi:glycosyltransferase involved in cell wall biosynthesis
VQARRPGVTLTIVGRGAPPAVEALGRRPGVRVTGWVDDLVSLLAEAEVAIAPLLSGGGTNLKVIEALAAGRAVVTTPFGAQGLDVTDRAQLFVADGAEEFAARVEELLGDEQLRRRLGTAGRERAAARYDWDVVGGLMYAALERWLT